MKKSKIFLVLMVLAVAVMGFVSCKQAPSEAYQVWYEYDSLTNREIVGGAQLGINRNSNYFVYTNGYTTIEGMLTVTGAFYTLTPESSAYESGTMLTDTDTYINGKKFATGVLTGFGIDGSKTLYLKYAE